MGDVEQGFFLLLLEVLGIQRESSVNYNVKFYYAPA